MPMAKVFKRNDQDGWYFMLDMQSPEGPFRTKKDAIAALRLQAEPVFHLLTIQWRSWDRTVELYRTHGAAKKRIEAIAAENYPDDEGNLDLFSEHGHSWWIDEISPKD